MTRAILRIALLAGMTAWISAAAAQYEVELMPGTQDLSLTLKLQPVTAAPVKLLLSGIPRGVKAQVSDVRCGERLLPRGADGNWIAPADCAAVTWRVVPDRVSAEGADASRQRTLSVGREPWYLLAEPSSLLRPFGTTGDATIRAAQGTAGLTGATPVGADAFRVPSAFGAPEFYVLGHVEPTHRTVGPFEVRYIADDAPRVNALNLEALHGSILDYLLRIVPPVPGPDRSLLVVWLGVAESRGKAGGAAGGRSFIANYVIGSAAHAQRNLALTMMTIAHEQFHQLVDVARGHLSSPPLPAWLNESLAQYYGLKALLATSDSASAREVRDEFIDLRRPVARGLLDLSRRYQAGDRSGYPLFYSQGATLWHAVDSAIATGTNGTMSLDDFVGELLRAESPANGSLPASFVAQLRRVGGPTIDVILQKYVGD